MTRVEPQPEPRSLEADRPRRRRGPASSLGVLLLISASALVGSSAPASAQPGGALKEVAFDQNLNAQIPLTTKFVDEQGQKVMLSDYFGKRPVILVMGYSNCPMLCSKVAEQMIRSLKVLDASVGKEFDILTVSINPKETPEQADKQRRTYLKRYSREGAEAGWHALTGDEQSISRLAKAVGFKYTYNPKLNLYAHAAGFVLLTPSGRVSRYFYGVEFPAREMKPALADASESKIGSPIDRLLMYCYDYDPDTGKYTFAIMNAIRVFGVATALALGTFMFVMFRRDRRMAFATKASNPNFLQEL
jgi:protein SCO1